MASKDKMTTFFKQLLGIKSTTQQHCTISIVYLILQAKEVAVTQTSQT